MNFLKKYCRAIFWSTYFLLFFSCVSAFALQYTADSNRGDCVAGYTRTAPGDCTRDGFLVLATYTNSVSCQSITITELPSQVKGLRLHVETLVKSQNSAGLISLHGYIYPATDTTCVLGYTDDIFIFFREQTPITVGLTLIDVATVRPMVPTDSSKKLNISTTFSHGATSGTMRVSLMGYTD